jgi:hypothetical protein
MKLFLLCLLVSVSAFAQNVPNAPSWKAPLKDPFFWAGTVFHASSVIADVAHVQACEAAKTCFEANPPSDQYKYRVPEIAPLFCFPSCNKWYQGVGLPSSGEPL